jgi:hypothetical protein
MSILRRSEPKRADRDGLPPSRPALRPGVRWARWALVFLLAFTLLRGVVWSVTFPPFFGPDEDYHFLYAEYLTTQHALPDPDKYLYPREYPKLVEAMHYDDYAYGPRITFDQQLDPKYSIKQSEWWPESDREPFERGRGVGVVHPPGYHVAAAAVNWSLGDASVFTRYQAVRWVSSAFGVLLVFAAWLLAAQVFRNESLRLLVAFLVAVQPMVGLLSGIANHDVLVAATFTLATAFMLFLMRSPPSPRQGLWLGATIVLALLTKGTALVLIPLAGLAYGAQALAHRGQLRTVVRSTVYAGAVVLVAAGGWYAFNLIAHGTLTGAVGDEAAGAVAGGPQATLDNLWAWTKQWTGFTYRTYWFHHFWYEAPKGSVIFYLPGYIGAVGLLGLGMLAVRRGRELFSPERPLVRQVAFLAICALALYVPLLYVDIQHQLDGKGFSMTGGRYLLPAYAGVATCLVVGLRELISRRAQPVVFAGLAALGAWFCWSVYTKNYLHRYYGDEKQSLDTLLRNMSFDRPEFVTPTTLRVTFALILLSLLAAAVAVGVGNLPPGAADRLRARLPARRGRLAAAARSR